MGLRFGVLGPLLVQRDGEQVELPRSGVLRGLLGVLLLAEGEPLLAGRLAELVWDARAEGISRGAVQVGVSRLRAWLEGLDPGAGDAVTVEHAGGGYRLATDPRAVDLGCLREQLELAARAQDPARRCALLVSAWGLVRGPVLADLPLLDASDALLRRAQETVRQAGLALAAAASASGRPQDAVGPLQALVAAQPLDEPVVARLIGALAACGRSSEALGCYELLRGRLAEQLGVSPSEPVQRAHLAVLAGDREPSAAAPGRAAVPRMLPADVADFTGRAEPLALLDGLLAEEDGDGREDGGQVPTVVISAIAGIAGVGKTALAVHWAHRVAERFPDGQLHVDLHGYAAGPPIDPSQALSQFLHALGVEPDKVPVEVEQAAGLYRSLLAGRRLLVVLDNARDAEQVRPLLPGSQGCLVLVTSRDRLTGLVASHALRRLELDVLRPGEAVTLLAGIVGEARVRAEPEATAELARACGWLPLALRIAAANLVCHPGWSVAGYAERLRGGDRLAELAVDGDPQAAVGVAFDSSYARLDAAARRLFRLLGLVPGADVTAEAAAALGGMPVAQAARLLERLAGAHLVEPRPSGRFGLHDLLRAYARQRADLEEPERARQQAVGRLLGWYLHAADAASRLLYPQTVRLAVPPADQRLAPMQFREHADALDWLARERANLAAAIRHAAVHGHPSVAWLLADTLRRWFWEHPHAVDWLAVARAGLAAAMAAGQPRAQAASQRGLGQVHQRLGDYAQAAEHFASAVALARQDRWAEGEAVVLSQLASVQAELGQLHQAADQLRQSLAVNRRIGSKNGEVGTLVNLGHLERQLGRPARAVDHLSEARSLIRQVGSDGVQDREEILLATLGEAERDLGRLAAAADHLDQAVALARMRGSGYDEAYDVLALAMVHRDAGRLEPALAAAEAAYLLVRQIGDQRIEADALNTLGTIRLRLGDDRRAASHHRAALELARQVAARCPETEALLGLAATCQRRGRHAEALAHAERARTLAREAGFRILEGWADAALAAAHLDLGHDGEAAAHAERAVAIHRQTGHRLGEAHALVALGHTRHRAGDQDGARCRWQEAAALLVDVGSADADQVSALLDDLPRR